MKQVKRKLVFSWLLKKWQTKRHYFLLLLLLLLSLSLLASWVSQKCRDWILFLCHLKIICWWSYLCLKKPVSCWNKDKIYPRHLRRPFYFTGYIRMSIFVLDFFKYSKADFLTQWTTKSWQLTMVILILLLYLVGLEVKIMTENYFRPKYWPIYLPRSRISRSPHTCHSIGTPYLIRNIASNFTQETTHKEILAANTCEILMNIKIPNNGH